MEILDAFYQPTVIDCWTVVTNERDPPTGYYTMLALGHAPTVFSQWTEGRYTPGGDNSQLGHRVCLISGTLLTHVLARIAEGETNAATEI